MIHLQCIYCAIIHKVLHLLMLVYQMRLYFFMTISEENKRVIITLPLEIYKKLQSKAKKEMRSISNMGSIIIVKHFQESEISK